MEVLVDLPWSNAADWLAELRRQGEGIAFRAWPEVPAPGRIEAALVWAPDPALFEGLDRLRAIIVPGAGVDQLWRAAPGLPDVPVVRLVDPVMAARMAQYLLAMVLDHHRQLDRYRTQQAAAFWQRYQHPDPADIQVGLLGLGSMGQAAAGLLQAVGYRIAGWSRTPKRLDGVRCFAGPKGLPALLADSRVLACLLPLTPATRGILNAATFAALPWGAMLVNLGRGGHLVEADLLAALDAGQLGRAVLDVFADEPLPAASPLWRHPRITVTPHIASLSNPRTGAAAIVAALRRLQAGLPPTHPVDRARGY
jgi:glyoxylate/hydroxypyruvate reductase A